MRGFMRVKIFFDLSAGKIEEHINAWLEEKSDKIEINHITQSESGSDITISIFYTEKAKTA